MVGVQVGVSAPPSPREPLRGPEGPQGPPGDPAELLEVLAPGEALTVDDQGQPTSLGPVVSRDEYEATSSLRVRSMLDAAVIAGPPTMTLGTLTTAIPGSVLTAADAPGAPFRFEGVIALDKITSYLAPREPKRTDSPSGSRRSMRVAFDFDGSDLELLVYAPPSGARIRLWINERPTSATFPNLASDNVGHLLRVQFADRAQRRIVVEGCDTFYFGGVRCLPSDTIAPPMIPAGLRLAVVGDSFSVGVGADGTGTAPVSCLGYVETLSRVLGLPNTISLGVSGTGYIRVPSATYLPYQGRISDVALVQPDVILVQGSLNDGLHGGTGELGPAVAAYIAALRAVAPTARRFFTGPLETRTTGGAAAASNAVAVDIKAAVVAAGETFIDARGWFTGTGKADAPTGDGNADHFRAADGTHPTAAGHAYIGRRLAAAIAPKLGLSV